jgi:hypothetical protein
LAKGGTGPETTAGDEAHPAVADSGRFVARPGGKVLR